MCTESWSVSCTSQNHNSRHINVATWLKSVLRLCLRGAQTPLCKRLADKNNCQPIWHPQALWSTVPLLHTRKNYCDCRIVMVLVLRGKLLVFLVSFTIVEDSEGILNGLETTSVRLVVCAQAMDRAHRIGQTRPVLVFRLATAHSVEGRLLQRANSKLMLERLVIKQVPSSLQRMPLPILDA